ncbi:phosphonate ABC transporter phosphate-binding periplasmic component [Halarchaeum acidiphilum MH1-52-1]|uniref:Phosphonate ABC transporter phosphate-binding periplasmic component n=1 Tax=Halarchaeum acidiphilum MH1-52-1 TaxID=1261545 RepID=U3AFP4_9EURY|nr:phosphate/phosphite/phosphonate ABC transporter substrate-binding protein [Halarchaeum acidiphilum]GAD53608.1 phosphonate ABC transporter phosphate-binding periplasmic component [Halarchaeum acidiphilum MH1-52-1]
MRRRTYVRAVGGAALVGAAGCLGGTSGDGASTDDDASDGEATGVGAWADGSIEFGLPPFENADDLLANYRPTFRWLESGLDGVTAVEGVPTTSYSAVVESVTNGHTELANLSPVTYVLSASEGIHPLVLNWSHGREFYRSYVATRDGTGIESLADVEGKTIAMVDPLSTSGGMYPRYMLSQAGLDAGGMDTEPGDFTIQWAFGHDDSLRALQEGHVDVAAYGDFQHPDDDPSIRKVAESQPIPFDPIVAKPDTPAEVRDAIKARLLDTPEARLEDSRIDKFGPVEDDRYDPVRDVVTELGVELGDLDDG